LTSRWVRQAHCSASVSQRVAVSVSMNEVYLKC
jgi:hypothetical protein